MPESLKNITGSLILIILFLSINLFAFSYRNYTDSTRQLLRLKVFNIAKPTKFDETVIYFDSNATMNYNPYYDAFKLMNTALDLPNVYVIGTLDTFAIKCYPVVKNKELLVPIGMRFNSSGTYEINATEVFNFDKISVILFDSLNRKAINLKDNPNDTINFNKGIIDGRFYIKFKPDISTGSQNLSPKSLSNRPFYTFVINNTVYIKIHSSDLRLQNSDFSFSVFNQLGQCQINNKSFKDNISFSLQKGVYLIRINSQYLNKTYIKKVVVN